MFQCGINYSECSTRRSLVSPKHRMKRIPGCGKSKEHTPKDIGCFTHIDSKHVWKRRFMTRLIPLIQLMSLTHRAWRSEIRKLSDKKNQAIRLPAMSYSSSILLPDSFTGFHAPFSEKRNFREMCCIYISVSNGKITRTKYICLLLCFTASLRH